MAQPGWGEYKRDVDLVCATVGHLVESTESRIHDPALRGEIHTPLDPGAGKAAGSWWRCSRESRASMLTIDVRADIAALTRSLNEIQRKQIPFRDRVGHD